MKLNLLVILLLGSMLSACAYNLGATFRKVHLPVLLGCVSQVGGAPDQCPKTEEIDFKESVAYDQISTGNYIEKNLEGTGKLSVAVLRALAGRKDANVFIKSLDISVRNVPYHDINTISVSGVIQKPGKSR